ncbi:MAG: metalloregulator ArsR/SmtB family transcription factor [bacterium]|jgi:DNA-binding transcriptional ArsR family regulator
MKVNDDCCDMFKALSARTRVRILEALKKKGPLGAKKIAIIVGVTPAAVSQHLKVLKQAGLVRSERHGYRIPYHVDVDAMRSCQTRLVEVCACGPGDSCRPPSMLVRRRREPNLKDLEQYRKRLEKELEAVNERIKKLARKKGA